MLIQQLEQSILNRLLSTLVSSLAKYLVDEEEELGVGRGGLMDRPKQSFGPARVDRERFEVGVLEHVLAIEDDDGDCPANSVSKGPSIQKCEGLRLTATGELRRLAFQDESHAEREASRWVLIPRELSHHMVDRALDLSNVELLSKRKVLGDVADANEAHTKYTMSRGGQCSMRGGRREMHLHETGLSDRGGSSEVQRRAKEDRELCHACREPESVHLVELAVFLL